MSGITLFDRKWDLQFSTTKVNINLSNLQFEFNTTAWVSGTPKILRLRIWNPLPKTILPLQTEGAQIVLQAGYQKGQYGIIFSGQVIQTRTGRTNGTDTYIDITASDGDMFYTSGFISTAIYPEATGLENRIFQIVENTQLPSGQMTINPSDVVIDTSTSTNNILPRGRVYFGMAKDHLRAAARNVGATYEISGTEAKVLSTNLSKNLPIPVFNYKTGLIGTPVQTLEGIEFQVLLNPMIVQGMTVQMNSNAIAKKEAQILPGGGAQGYSPSLIPQVAQDGLYKVLYCNHKGNTRGNDWYTTIVGYNPVNLNKNQSPFLGASVEDV